MIVPISKAQTVAIDDCRFPFKPLDFKTDRKKARATRLTGIPMMPIRANFTTRFCQIRVMNVKIVITFPYKVDSFSSTYNILVASLANVTTEFFARISHYQYDLFIVKYANYIFYTTISFPGKQEYV